MSQFYKPIPLIIRNVPVLVYPMLGVEKLVSQEDKSSIQSRLEKLYESNNEIVSGKMHIVILWADGDSLMTDIWQYLQLESEDTGFTIDCKTFKNLHPISGSGLTASDGLIMLGRETELQEESRKNSVSTIDFVLGIRPELPGEINPTVDFYK